MWMKSIKHLPRCVHSSLRSSVVLFNLTRVVEELIINSLHAGSSKIHVFLGVEASYIKVEDDGYGISRDGLVLLGEKYATSKLNSLVAEETGIESLVCRGETLRSLSDISLLEVITKARGRPNGYRKVIKGCKSLFLGIDDHRKDVGTTVIVHDLFYNQPVRRKCMRSSPKKLLHSVRKCVLQTALVHPQVSFIVTDIESESELFRTQPSLSPLPLLSTAFGNEVSCSLHEINISEEALTLSGYLSGPAVSFSTKAFQFVYINSRFVSNGTIHKLLNTMATSSFGSLTSLKGEPEFQNAKRHKTQAYPAFLLNLCCPPSSYELTYEPSKMVVEFKDWLPILSFIEQAVRRLWRSTSKNFLQREPDVYEHNVPKDELWMKDPFNSDLFASSEIQKDRSKSIHSQTCNSERLCTDSLQKPVRDSFSSFQKNHSRALTNPSFLELTPGLDAFHVKRGQMEGPVSKTNFSNPKIDFYPFEDHFMSELMEPQVAKAKENVLGSRQDQFNETNSCLLRQSLATDEFKYKEIPRVRKSLFSSNHISGEDLLVGSTPFNQGLEIQFGNLEDGTNWDTDDYGIDLLNEDCSRKSLGYFARKPSATSQIFSPVMRKCSRSANIDVVCNDFSKHQAAGSVAHNHLLIEIAEKECSVKSTRPGLHSRSPPFACSDLFNGEDLPQRYETGGSMCSQKSFRHFIDAEEGDELFNCDFDQGKTMGCANTRIFVKKFFSPESIMHDFFRPGAHPSKPISGEISLCRKVADGMHDFSGRGAYSNEPISGEISLSEKVTDGINWLDIDDRAINHFQSSSSTFVKMVHDNMNDEKEMQIGYHLSSPNIRLRSFSAPPQYKGRRKFYSICSVTNHELRASSTCGPLETDDSHTCARGGGKMERSHRAQLAKTIPDCITSELEYSGASVSKWRNGEPQASVEHKLHTSTVHEVDVLDISTGLLHLSGGSLVPESINKDFLESPKVLQQLDKKFIPVISEGTLGIIDQHAADERIRLEELREKVLSGEERKVSYLDTEKELVLPDLTFQLLQSYAEQIETWGWICKTHAQGSGSFAKNLNVLCRKPFAVTLVAVPCILGINLSEQDLIDFLEQLLETDGSSTTPPAVIRILNFKSCRGAIMFGDSLLHSECALMVEELKKTSLCFQCAHGRPTTVPIVNLEVLHKQIAKLRTQCGNENNQWHGLQLHKPTFQRAKLRLES
ncbi:DNA mismatch repair protein MLH3 [Aristolochia californica]|uniref:DNA mismatch repair protein MLH3 n=1 Tax=Aristolochia californica TaxID=171875 RepID=UPI0035DDED74